MYNIHHPESIARSMQLKRAKNVHTKAQAIRQADQRAVYAHSLVHSLEPFDLPGGNEAGATTMGEVIDRLDAAIDALEPYPPHHNLKRELQDWKGVVYFS